MKEAKSNNTFCKDKLLEQQIANACVSGNRKKFKGVDCSKSTGIDYNIALQKLVGLIKADIDQLLIPTIEKLAPEFQNDSLLIMDSYVTDITSIINKLINKWSSPQVKKVANQVASLFVRRANEVNRKRFNSSMKSVGMDVYGDSPQLDDLLEVATINNVKLIESIPEQYLNQVQSILLGNIRAGNRSGSIVKQLQEQFGISKNKAKFIARDQTAKINGELVAKRQQSVGFQYFQWLDSDDIRVRQRHKDIENKVTAYGKGIYRWDDPPLSDSGNPIIPGQDYNCRCVSIPVSNAQVEMNQRQGLVNKGVLK